MLNILVQFAKRVCKMSEKLQILAVFFSNLHCFLSFSHLFFPKKNIMLIGFSQRNISLKEPGQFIYFFSKTTRNSANLNKE